MASKGHRAVNDKRSKREARVARVAAVQPTLYEAPPTVDCDERVIQVETEFRNVRITEHLWIHEGRLVKFSIILSICLEEGEAWDEDYSIDTGHGYLHEHPLGHRIGEIRRNVSPLYTQVDVQESFDQAYSMVHARYLKKANRG